MENMETFFAQFIQDWWTSARPLLIADEVRLPDPLHREIVAFVICCTNTRHAVELADQASDLRAEMRPQDAASLIKGSDLYGRRVSRRHDHFRNYVETAVGNCTAVVRVVTTSQTITRYQAIAPGGIRRAHDAQESITSNPIRGRELVPFMNMVKVAAAALRFDAVQADVLVDRSAQLGLAPAQLGVEENDLVILGPDTLNVTADGSPAEFACPTAFRFISTAEESAFRDLLLLPDSVAYRLRRTLGGLAERLSSADFLCDVLAPHAVMDGRAAAAHGRSVHADRRDV